MTNQNENVLLTAALKYRSMGFSVIPTGPDKKPLLQWKEYQSKIADESTIRGWWTNWPKANVAIVTGKISGIVVVDVEKGGPYEKFDATATAETGGGGYHYYYQHPGVLINNRTRIDTLVDIRADGGYVIAPPSVTTKGPYSWVGTFSRDEIKPMSPGLLARLQEQTHIETVDLRKPTPATEVVTPPTAASAGLIQEGQRNDSATRFLGKIIAKIPFDLWNDVAWPALLHWNATKVEKPLPAREMRGIFESITQRERSKKPRAEAFVMDTITLDALMAKEFPPTRYLANHLIPMGGVTAITGAPSSYKSFLMLELSRAVARGTPFLGHFETIQGKVLIVDKENKDRLVQERFQALGELGGTNCIEAQFTNTLYLDNPEHLAALAAYIEEKQFTLVILDSLVRFHQKDENSAKDIAVLMGAIKQLTSNNRAVVFIHHHRKTQFGQGSTEHGQNIRGSGDILAAVDAHLAIDREDRTLKVRQSKLRTDYEIRPFKVRVEEPQDVPGVKTRFVHDGVDTDKEDLLNAVCDNVLDAIKDSDSEVTVEDLIERLEISEAMIRATLKILEAGKQITSRSGKHNKKFYKAVEGPVATSTSTVDQTQGATSPAPVSEKTSTTTTASEEVW